MDKKKFETAYRKLNTQQRNAVDTIEGPVMVVAGPGTGKTQILTLRIANILAKTDANPENILALTFTNSGTRTMRQKLIDYTGDEGYRISVFTFHSFAEYIIREFSSYFKKFEFAKVITDLEKVQILEEIISSGSYMHVTSMYDRFSSLTNIRSAIDSLKQEGWAPKDLEEHILAWEKSMYENEDVFYKVSRGKHKVGDIKPSEKEKIEKKVLKVEEVHDIFSRYQHIIEERGLYDFSDMILTVLAELEHNENLKFDLQEKFQYVLVDEHQDTNDGQNKLIELLTNAPHLSGRPNLFTVGDEKQSIYRFQGASEETFDHFLKMYTDVGVVRLEQNYRSTQHILDAAHSLITCTKEDAQNLKSNKTENLPVQIGEFSNYKFELLSVAHDIKKKLEQGVSPREIAVIYRSNKHVADVVEVLSVMNIPYTVLSKEDVLGDIHINNLLLLLQVIANPTDDRILSNALFARFLNFDAYEISKVLNHFKIYCRDGKGNLFDFISNKELLLSANIENVEQFQTFTKTIKELMVTSRNLTFLSFLKEYLEKIGYIQFMLATPDSQDQLLRLDKLFDEVKRQIQNKKEYTLADFIIFINLYKKYHLTIETSSPDIVEGVQLMTAHKSKGLEFEYVYLIGATRKNWEKSRGGSQLALPIESYRGGEHDERRLFYVAMTRAKTNLSISFSLTDWEGSEQEKSQFISEIDTTYTQKIDTSVFEKEHVDDLRLFITHHQQSKSLWSTEYLSSLFIARGLSVTALNNYLSCPIEYLFKNLLQLPSSYQANLAFGNVVHDALEHFFKASNEGKKLLSKKDLITFFEQAMNASSLYGDDYTRYAQHGNDILDGYYETYHNEWATATKSEERIKRQFEYAEGAEITLNGIIDKIEYLNSVEGGDIRIIDYKTGKPYSEKSSKKQKDDLTRQIIFYHLLMVGYRDNNFKIREAVLDFLEKNKKGEFEQKSIEVGDEEIHVLENLIRTVATEITS